MSGTTAARRIDHSKTQDGVQFLKRLIGDSIIGEDALTLDQVVDGLFKKDANGEPDFSVSGRVDAANRLIASLEELDRTDVRTDEQKAAWGEVKAKIHEIIENTAYTTPQQVAAGFEKYQQDELRKPDADRKDLWTLFDRSGSDFAVTFNDAQLAQLRYALNRLAPGLGDVICGLIDHMSGNVDGVTGPDRIVKNELEQGFNAMMHGDVSMGAFWDREYNENVNASGETEQVRFNLWNGPGNAEDTAAFFTDAGMRGHGYQFYDDDMRTYKQSFKDMVVSKWEEDGVVNFDSDAARDQFVAYSRQLVMGGELDASFANTLEQNDTIEFSNDAAKQAFIDFTKTIDTRAGSLEDGLTTEQYIAKEVMEFVEGRSDINFKATDAAFDPTVYYAPTRDAIMAASQHYVPVQSSAEYAALIMEHARHPGSGMQVNMHSAVSAAPLSAAGGVRSGASGVSGPAQIKAVKLDDQESGYLDYGKAIEAKLSPSDLSVTAPDGTKLFTFSDEEFQVFSAKIINPGMGRSDMVLDAYDTKMTAQELHTRLGDGFKVQLVTHQDAGADVADSKVFGYYVESADGKTSFYVGSQGIPEDSVSDEMKAQRQQEIESGANSDRTSLVRDVKVEQDNGQDPVKVDSGTVDGQAQDPTMFTL